jgi:hypothetical protein
VSGRGGCPGVHTNSAGASGVCSKKPPRTAATARTPALGKRTVAPAPMIRLTTRGFAIHQPSPSTAGNASPSDALVLPPRGSATVASSPRRTSTRPPPRLVTVARPPERGWCVGVARRAVDDTSCIDSEREAAAEAARGGRISGRVAGGATGDVAVGSPGSPALSLDAKPTDASGPWCGA